MKKTLIILLVFTTSLVKAQDEVTVFNSDGNAAYYIDYSNNVIYTFDGNPVSYLNLSNNGGYNVYSFNGDHMGWYERGILWNHKGNIEGFIKGAITNVMIKMEPMKGMKKMSPIKMTPKMEPMKPMQTNNFATVPTDIFLNKSSRHRSEFSSPSENKVLGPYDKPYTSKDFVPTPLYHPPFEAFEKAANAHQQRYNQQQEKVNKLIEAGYTYDIEDNVYYSPEDWDKIKKNREAALKLIYEWYVKSAYYLGTKKIKNGKYYVIFFRPDVQYPKVQTGSVEIVNEKLKSMEYPGRKRRFKHAPKIIKGACLAKIWDKFGFTSNSVIYPECQFFVVD